MKDKELTFEAASARLEEIISLLSSESMTLSGSLELFKEASELVDGCSKLLKDASIKFETITDGYDEAYE